MISNSRKTLFATLGVLAAMLTLAFYSPVLYDTFCKVTGFGGTTQVAVKRPEAVLDRQVRVRLDTNTGRGADLKFSARDRVMDIRIGEIGMAFFEVTNPSDQPIIAEAGYNVAPHKVGPYFSKLECFCFEERVFEPGETVQLPVIFFVDPKLDDEATLDDVTDITLSYTFYGTAEPQENQTAHLEPETRRN